MPFRVVRRVIRRGEEQAIALDVDGDVLRIGRGTDNDLHLDDFGVSYSHATITASAGGHFLRDLTGAGLTLLNHQPVQEGEVRPGDLIRIGPYSLRLSSGEPLTVEVEETRDKGEGEEKVALFPRYTLSTTRWRKRTLGALACLLVLGITVLSFGLGKYRVFMPGEVSLKHSLFANDCSKCHTGWKTVWSPIPDKTCVACHSGPPHFGNLSQRAVPQCTACHVEHKGKIMLARIPDSSCETCHGDLKMKEGEPQFATSVRSFTKDHPEFAVSIPPADGNHAQRVRLHDKGEGDDHSQLRLNHKLHLAPDLAGPTGPEQLTCATCHRPDTQNAYMLPINYQRDCMRCHLLDFDDRLGVKTVPHPQKPEEIRKFLQSAYAEYYLLTHEAELRARGMVRRLPGALPTVEALWVGDMMNKAEQYLYSKKTKKCLLCHVVDFPAGAEASPVSGGSLARSRAAPVVAKTGVPVRWFSHSIFNHAPHNDLIKQKGCITCHAAAETSEQTSDVLLPSINTCRKCHFEPGGARTECVECHVYHDKSKARDSAHPYELEGDRPRISGGTAE